MYEWVYNINYSKREIEKEKTQSLFKMFMTRMDCTKTERVKR